MRSKQKLNVVISTLALVIALVGGIHLRATLSYAQPEAKEAKLVMLYQKVAYDEISAIYAAEDLDGNKLAVRSPGFSGILSSENVRFGKVVFRQGAWILVDMLN